MNDRDSLLDHVYIAPVDDIWNYPGSSWAVWERGNRLGEHGSAARGFKRLSEAKDWANDRFGIVSWQRGIDGWYYPKDLS